MTDEEYERRKDLLRPHLTEEFLSTLIAAAEITLCNSMEIDAFVVELFRIAGKPVPPRADAGVK